MSIYHSFVVDKVSHITYTGSCEVHLTSPLSDHLDRSSRKGRGTGPHGLICPTKRRKPPINETPKNQKVNRNVLFRFVAAIKRREYCNGNNAAEQTLRGLQAKRLRASKGRVWWSCGLPAHSPVAGGNMYKATGFKHGVLRAFWAVWSSRRLKERASQRSVTLEVLAMDCWRWVLYV